MAIQARHRRRACLAVHPRLREVRCAPSLRLIAIPLPTSPRGTPSVAAATSPPRGAMRVVGYDVVRKQWGNGLRYETDYQSITGWPKPTACAQTMVQAKPGQVSKGRIALRRVPGQSPVNPRFTPPIGGEGDGGASAPSGRGLRSPSRPPSGLERRTTKRPASKMP
jgi:hypothetical protein